MQASVESLGAELRQSAKAVEQTRREIEMEKNAGDAERVEAYYEEYVGKLSEQARREREKMEREAAGLSKHADEWRAWLGVLGAAARTLQAMSDAGDEAAKAIVGTAAWQTAAAEGGADGEGGATSEARLASLLVDVAAKHDARLTSQRKRLKELDGVEADLGAKLKKAADKVAAHKALTAHRSAPKPSEQLAAGLKAAGALKKKGRKKLGAAALLGAAGAGSADGGATAAVDEEDDAGGGGLPSLPPVSSATGATSQVDDA